MPAKLDRRGFFRRVTGGATPLRPPGAGGEAAFAGACDGCGACVGACPQAILVPGAGRLPVVDLSSNPCTFCGACIRACPTSALAGPPEWALRARIGPACLEAQGIACRVCETACDAAALRFRPMPGGRARVTADPDRCTGCGACLGVCPAGAIAVAPPEPQTEETAA